jgi:hypothetical protein
MCERTEERTEAFALLLRFKEIDMISNSEKIGHEVVRASQDVKGKTVKNLSDETLGKLIEVMIDKISGKVAYVVLESGSFLGMGGKLFALPWNSIDYDPNNECFILDVDKERLKNAPGFDKDNWPNMADKQWGASVSDYYGTKNYWE